MRAASVSGTLESIPLTDLLKWLGTGRKTGTLVIQGPKYSKTLVTRDGVLIASASTDPNDQLGHFLLRQGHITEENLRKAMEIQQKTRVMLGRILVSAGALREADLQAALVQKAEETIFGLFLWESGSFEFREGDVLERIQVPLSLKISDVLSRGLSWIEELEKIKSFFTTSQSIVARTTKPPSGSHADPSSLARRILELVDGKHSIADICLEVHASEFAVGRVLAELLEEGFIEVRKKAAARKRARPARPVAGLLDEARSLVRAGEAHAAIGILEEAGVTEPGNAEIAAALAEAREAFVHQAVRDGLRPDSVPALLKPLESLTSEDLTPEEMFLISRIDGTWDLRSILSVCPFPEADALLHLKKLKDRGLVGIQVAV